MLVDNPWISDMDTSSWGHWNRGGFYRRAGQVFQCHRPIPRDIDIPIHAQAIVLVSTSPKSPAIWSYLNPLLLHLRLLQTAIYFFLLLFLHLLCRWYVLELPIWMGFLESSESAGIAMNRIKIHLGAILQDLDISISPWARHLPC